MTVNSKPKDRNALKSEPLRDPGQSLRDELDNLINEDAMLWIVMAIVAGMWTVYEWIRWFADTGFHPIAMSVVSIPFIVYVVYRIRTTLPRIDRLKKGLRGERHAGQFLQNELLPLGFKVFHDLVEDGYNIDHVAVGPKGVFAIETKAFSKSSEGEAVVVVDGEQVWVNGNLPDRNPIQQAEAIADRVQKILPTLQSGPVKVQPVVLMGGWKIDRRKKPRRTWVVNFTGLSKFLEYEPEILAGNDVEYLNRVLSEHQRRSDAMNR